MGGRKVNVLIALEDVSLEGCAELVMAEFLDAPRGPQISGRAHQTFKLKVRGLSHIFWEMLLLPV